MLIAPLSSATARLIGSATGITSPCAVVKELLDNAIDAGADSVEVAVSSDTLERLRVRDNGQGIASGDIDGLARPAHTSKLAAFDELTTGRVRTLGFRGQALASIVGVSASVNVVTRTAREPVAARVRLGVREGRQMVSAPVGTTVEVEGLFLNLPPRRKILLKENKKTTARIKDLLMAYALANPALRVNFRVLGDERQACKFGQTKDRDMEQSVLEIFGAAVAANGQTHRFASTASPFTLLAFLPSVDGDYKALAGKGSFISVNGRPICSTLGIGKVLVGLFKTKMQQNWQQRGLPTVQKPLFLLEILCAFTDYDANVATLKDDVLFADADALLWTFEELCGQVYGKTAALGIIGQNATARRNGGESISCLMMPNAEEKLVSAQMRTAYKINMQRTNSNATDEEVDFQAIEVAVPERQQVETKASSGGKVDYFKDGVPKPLQGIERYFQRTAEAAADFEIAIDDTAMPECPAEEEEACHVDGTVWERMPLSDVPDSTLNILAGVHSSLPSDSSSQGEGPRLSDLHGTSWSIQNLVNQRVTLATRGGSSAAASPSRPVPQTRGGLMQRARVSLLRTPPPSDPRTREEPRSFVPVSRVVGQPSPVSSRSSPDGGGDGGGARVKEVRVGRPPQWPAMRQAALPGARNARYGAGRGGGVAGVPRPQNCPLPATRPRQQTATVEWVMARRLEYEEDEDGEDATPDGEGLRQDLMRTVGRAREVRQVLQAESETTADDGAETLPQAKRQRRATSRESARLVAAIRHTATPPRMQWPVKQPDSLLPLESVPAGMGSWQCVQTTDVSFSDVHMWMDLEREVDAYICSGKLTLGRLEDSLTGQDALWLETLVKRLCRV